MQFWTSILACCTTSTWASSPRDLNLDTYVKSQTRVALSGILANTYGVNSSFPGVIIASPATDTARAGESGGQNYYYQWTRDAALTVKTIINQYASGDASLEPLIRAYIDNESELQHLSTLSGNFTSGGLGEPKYYVNSTAFNSPWGRPQRDGPALRAISIMGFLNLQNDTTYAQNVTANIIKPDLDYVASEWQNAGFDLWEEQDDLHFFTAMVQGRALREGAAFMAKAGDNSSADNYLAQEARLSELVDSFWNATGTGTFDSHLNSTKPTGADCANLLASIHGSDEGAKYKPSSDKILASAATLIDEMTGLYAIDSDNGFTTPSVGRYPSDVYDGIQSSAGNPWFLCNSAMAETMHLAATEFSRADSLVVNTINRNFFSKVLSKSGGGGGGAAVVGDSYSGANLSIVVDEMRGYADQYFSIQQMHVGTNMSMSEQFNRTTAAQQGARDLTWSYAAFVSAARARSGQLTYEFTRGDASNVEVPGDASPANSSTTITDATTAGTTSELSEGAASMTSLSALLLAFSLFLCVL